MAKVKKAKKPKAASLDQVLGEVKEVMPEKIKLDHSTSEFENHPKFAKFKKSMSEEG